jgi:hypothetical protein
LSPVSCTARKATDSDVVIGFRVFFVQGGDHSPLRVWLEGPLRATIHSSLHKLGLYDASVESEGWPRRRQPRRR